MKNFKKVIALLVAALLIAASMSALADASQTGLKITIKSEVTGHTYKAYRIFAGAVDSNEITSSSKLSNITWDSGVKSATIIAKLYENATIRTKMDAKVEEINAAKAEGADDITYSSLTAAQVAECLSGISDATALRAMAAAFAAGKGSAAGTSTAVNGGYEISGLAAGYYLIEDAESTAEADDAFSDYIVNLIGNVSIDAKVAKPTVEKEAQDEVADKDNNSEDSTNGYGETADHAINESFNFKLTAKLPSDTDFAAYTTYKVIFTDTMSGGVAFEKIVSVTVDGKTVPATKYTLSDAVKNATAENPAGGAGTTTTWTLTIDDIKTAADGVDLTDGADVVVTYAAHLTDKATVTAPNGTTTDNENKVKLTYSNNPTTGGTGDTTEDEVYVFTYEVDNTKYANNEETPLAGAEFTLYESDGTTEVGLIYDNGMSAYRPIKSGETKTVMTSAETTGIFNIKGLDAGTYVLKETKTPDGYNTCDDVTITISADHEVKDGTPTVTLTNSSNMNNKIINKSGTTLPTTGGIGTTIFYVAGSILVLAAAVLLITKRRMNVND